MGTYIDTDTAADVRNIVADKVSRKASAILNGVGTHVSHPTYITRAMLKEWTHELKGMWDMYFEVMHHEDIDRDLSAKVNAARVEVSKLYKKRGA